jgi:hypothetical protein
MTTTSTMKLANVWHDINIAKLVAQLVNNPESLALLHRVAVDARQFDGRPGPAAAMFVRAIIAASNIRIEFQDDNPIPF